MQAIHAEDFKTRAFSILLTVVSIGTALAIIRPDSDTFFLFGGGYFWQEFRVWQKLVAGQLIIQDFALLVMYKLHLAL